MPLFFPRWGSLHNYSNSIVQREVKNDINQKEINKIKYLSSKKGKHDIYILWTFGLFTFGNIYYWKTCAFTVSRSQLRYR